MSGKLCEFLEWDSEFFGIRIARVIGDRLNSGEISVLDEWCKRNRINCLYFMADPNCQESNYLAENRQFHLVDTKVRLAVDLTGRVSESGEVQSFGIRPSMREDIESLKRMAKVCHYHSRFYYDPGFAEEACDNLYGTWIEKSCNGSSDIVLVAAVNDRPVGYVACNVVNSATGEIGLIGVSPEVLRLGIGTALVQASLKWFFQYGCESVEVVTQARNIPAQRIYQKCGFVTLSVLHCYHKWY